MSNKRFTPASDDGSFTRAEWQDYWSSLTPEERESIKVKAGREMISLSRVAREWGAR